MASGRNAALQVFDLGLACCAVEVAALASRGDVRLDPQPDETHVLVISGTTARETKPWPGAREPGGVAPKRPMHPPGAPR